MAIKINCPRCSREINFEDAQAGRDEHCPSCYHKFKVPNPETDKFGRIKCQCGEYVETWQPFLKDGVKCTSCGNVIVDEESPASEPAGDKPEEEVIEGEPAPSGSKEGSSYSVVESGPGKKAPEGKMFCRKCGAENASNNYRCVDCGAKLHSRTGVVSRGKAPTIQNYLVQAILVTICCCLPFGIVAIVYAAGVNGKIQAGDYAGAREAARKAKMWSLIGFIVGLAWAVLYLGFNFIAMGTM